MLNSETVSPAAKTFTAQQKRFDIFREAYNHERPHEALDQTPPAMHYQPSPREYPSKLPEIQYPDYFVVRPVCHSGVVYAHTGQVYIAKLLRGEYVGFDEIDDGIWEVYFGSVRLGGYNLRDKKGGNTPYWTLKV